MANVKVTDIEALGSFRCQAASFVSELQSRLQYLLHQLRNNLQEAEDTIHRMERHKAELEAAVEDEDDYYELQAYQELLQEARNRFAELQSVFAQLQATANGAQSRVSSLTSDATDFVSRYMSYLESQRHV